MPEGIRRARVRQRLRLLQRVVLHQDGRRLRARVLQELDVLIEDGAPGGRVHVVEAGAVRGFALALGAEGVAAVVEVVVRNKGAGVDDGADGVDGGEGRLVLVDSSAGVVGDGDHGGLALVGKVKENGHGRLKDEVVEGGYESLDLVVGEDEAAGVGAVCRSGDGVGFHGR